MKQTILFVYLLFVVYYLYTLYVFRRLNQNPCSCKKLEGYKQTWNFKYVMVMTPLLLLANLYYMYKILRKNQIGGSSYVLMIQLLFVSGFAASFFNDYAIINLFNKMKSDECPCNNENRRYLMNATWGKIALNIVFFVSAAGVMNSKNLNKIVAKSMKNKK